MTTLEENIPPGIHIDLFITLCDIFKYKLEEKDIIFVHNVVLTFCTNNIQMDNLIAWFMDNNYTWLLIHLGNEHDCLLTSALCFNALNARIIVKVYNSHSFDLGIILHYNGWYKRLDVWLKAVEYLPDSVDIHKLACNFTLHKAALIRSVKMIRSLLSVGLNVNSKNEHGDTPLHCVFFMY